MDFGYKVRKCIRSLKRNRLQTLAQEAAITAFNYSGMVKTMPRHCYKAILPKGFVRELKKDFEIYFRSPTTNRDAEDIRKEIGFKLHVLDENVTIVSAEEYEEVAKVNALPPRQLTLF